MKHFAALILALFSNLILSFVFYKYYQWFAISYFHLPEVSCWVFWAIINLSGTLNIKIDDSTSWLENSSMETIIIRIISTNIMYMCHLVLGYIVYIYTIGK